MIAYKVLTVIQSGGKTYKVSYCGSRSMLDKPAIIENTINCTKVYHPAPGVLAKANPKSLGIFCLDNLEVALTHYPKDTEIWKVEGIGKAERPKLIDTHNMLRYNLDRTTYSDFSVGLYGTICFLSIRFIEQVRKVDFTVPQCVDCGRSQKVRDSNRGNWKAYRCAKCFELWRKSLPPMGLKLYDMRTGALIGRGRRYDV